MPSYRKMVLDRVLPMWAAIITLNIPKATKPAMAFILAYTVFTLCMDYWEWHQERRNTR